MKNVKKNIIISSHTLFDKKGNDIYGTGSSITDYLSDKKINHLYIKHPIYGGISTQIDVFWENKKITFKNKSSNSTNLLLKSLQELIITLRIIFKQPKKFDIFIGIDPLNAFFGWIAKKLGKVQRLVFYTADYTPTRFDNKIFNWIYHAIDRLMLKKADEIWNVSTRITGLRKKQGVPEIKNYFVPNSPMFNKIKRLNIDKINKHELVFVTTSAKSTDFSVIFKALKKLSSKYPDIILRVIGLNNWEDQFEEEIAKLGIDKKVLFSGRMPHVSLLKIFCKAAVGLALYTNKFSWTYYSDSMKARDYLACGLPVIMTDISSTAQDVKKADAGFVIKLDSNELFKVIDRLFADVKYYSLLRNNATKLAEKYDIYRILDKRL